MHHRKSVQRNAQELKDKYKQELIAKAKDQILIEEKWIESLRVKTFKTKKAQEKNDAIVKAYDDRKQMIASLVNTDHKTRRKFMKLRNIPKALLPKFSKERVNETNNFISWLQWHWQKLHCQCF
jgi:ribosomal protein S8